MNKSLSYEELYIDANKLLKEKDKRIQDLAFLVNSNRETIKELKEEIKSLRDTLDDLRYDME